MDILEVVGLPALMAVTSGRREVTIGLLDGPVAIGHPNLASESIRGLPEGVPGGCAEASSSACQHGTFVAGILSARRGSSAPGICPDCSLLVRPIFSEAVANDELLPSATPQQLATAICECIDAGAWVVNLSAAMGQPSISAEPELHDALDYAARQGVIVVAAAGNQGMLGSSVITRHRWVVPVVGYGVDGRPMVQSNLGRSMGRHGLGAPGEDVTSLSSSGEPPLTLAGTSFAAAFVTGAIALLWSAVPDATAVEVKHAVCYGQRRVSVVPPLLDAWGAYQMLSATHVRRVPA